MAKRKERKKENTWTMAASYLRSFECSRQRYESSLNPRHDYVVLLKITSLP